ncbi:MAG: metal dependent phosphohydrolase [Oscillospiraceae bacterium]|jgi:HD-GYP domain-containing protein (c-di-GMP phosphodiesterase class II)|nr:metal dependent phosphohydrolase [Oscillospiraceae bacterium]
MNFELNTRLKPVLQTIKLLPDEDFQHSRRVGLLVELFTQWLVNTGFLNDPVEAYQFFGQAATFHDIGKAWIPKEILTKSSQLSNQERDIMCRHPALSMEYFDRIADVFYKENLIQEFALMRDCAVYHHEWWNGAGYPYKKAYEEIPVIAHITAICDAYDSMTSTRVYHVAQTHEYACQELMRCAGTQFQPALVLKFLSSHISLADVIDLKLAHF